MFRNLYIVASIIVFFAVLVVFEEASAVVWIVTILITYSWLRAIYKKFFLKNNHKNHKDHKNKKNTGILNTPLGIIISYRLKNINFIKFNVIYFISSVILLFFLAPTDFGEPLVYLLMIGYLIMVMVYTPFRRITLFIFGIFGLESFSPDFEEIESSIQDKSISKNTTPNVHLVEAHSVSGYERKDGVFVNGYWRDGDGDTSVNIEDGEYLRSNPDDNPNNNLN